MTIGAETSGRGGVGTPGSVALCRGDRRQDARRQLAGRNSLLTRRLCFGGCRRRGARRKAFRGSRRNTGWCLGSSCSYSCRTPRYPTPDRWARRRRSQRRIRCPRRQPRSPPKKLLPDPGTGDPPNSCLFYREISTGNRRAPQVPTGPSKTPGSSVPHRSQWPDSVKP